MTRRRVFAVARTIHAYAGIVCSLVLMTIGLSGALLVFKDDYLRAALPAAREAPDLSPAALTHVLDEAEAAFTAERMRAVIFARDDFGLHKAYLTDGSAAYLNSRGAIIDAWSPNGRIEDWLLDLHHHLLAGDAGGWATGFFGLAAIALVGAGCVAYWPARRGARRGVLPRSSERLEVLSAHRNLGALVAPLVLLAVTTGVIITFPSTSRSFFDMFGEDAATAPRPQLEESAAPSAGIAWAAGLASAMEAFPAADPRIAIWPKKGGAPSFRLKQAEEWHPNGRTQIIFDPATGAPAHVKDALNLNSGRQAFNAVYPLHAAGVGGRLYDALLAAAGFALVALGALGSFAFIRHRVRTLTSNERQEEAPKGES
ncbi:MAG: PepSY-associated TM helix domain-containing protein [Pseudomonadota bacterium]